MDNKETDLYLKNELIYDTVTKYVENLKKVEKQVKYISTRMKSTSISEWGGVREEQDLKNRLTNGLFRPVKWKKR